MPESASSDLSTLQGKFTFLQTTFQIIKDRQHVITEALKQYKIEPHDTKLEKHETVQAFLDYYIDAAQANQLAIQQFDSVSKKLETLLATDGSTIRVRAAVGRSIGNDFANLHKAMSDARQKCQPPKAEAYDLRKRAEHTENDPLKELASALAGATLNMGGIYGDCLPMVRKLCTQYPERGISPPGSA